MGPVMNALFDPLATSFTALPDPQEFSAAWIRDVSMVVSLATALVATARVAVSVVQAAGMVGSAGRFASPAPHAPVVPVVLVLDDAVEDPLAEVDDVPLDVLDPLDPDADVEPDPVAEPEADVDPVIVPEPLDPWLVVPPVLVPLVFEPLVLPPLPFDPWLLAPLDPEPLVLSPFPPDPPHAVPRTTSVVTATADRRARNMRGLRASRGRQPPHGLDECAAAGDSIWARALRPCSRARSRHAHTGSLETCDGARFRSALCLPVWVAGSCCRPAEGASEGALASRRHGCS